MKVSVPKETAAGERRVALVPEVVQRLSKQGGHEVVVEAGAGDPTYPDAEYAGAGASTGDGLAGEVVAKVPPPSSE
jgi:NAD(P) transhydrogenase subunit alpha